MHLQIFTLHGKQQCLKKSRLILPYCMVYTRLLCGVAERQNFVFFTRDSQEAAEGETEGSTFTNASQESNNQQRPQVCMRCKRCQHCEERPHPYSNFQDHIGRVAIRQIASCARQAQVSACFPAAEIVLGKQAVSLLGITQMNTRPYLQSS